LLVGLLLVAVCWLLLARWLLVAGCWLLDVRTLDADTGCWSVHGFRLAPVILRAELITWSGSTSPES
jgi:hypothetical protein